MTEALTAPQPIIALQPLGDPAAAACEGDFCEIPDHHTQAVVNRKLDDDAV
ncbi:hypothetical protein [Schumannella luteola]